MWTALHSARLRSAEIPMQRDRDFRNTLLLIIVQSEIIREFPRLSYDLPIREAYGACMSFSRRKLPISFLRPFTFGILPNQVRSSALQNLSFVRTDTLSPFNRIICGIAADVQTGKDVRNTPDVFSVWTCGDHYKGRRPVRRLSKNKELRNYVRNGIV